MLINQIQRILLSFLFCIFIANIGYAQKILTSEEAYIQDLELSKTVKIVLKKEFHHWYSIHLQRLDLISKIKNRHDYVLNFYHNSGYTFRLLGQHRESLKLYRGFFTYYDANEALFSPELKQKYLGERSFDYRGMAVAYQNLALLDSANFVHQKNLKYTDTMTNIYKPAAINDYGMFLYGGMKKSDLALKNFIKAYTITKNHFPEHFLLGSIRNNMAIIYFERGEMEPAKTLYINNFEFYKKTQRVTASYNTVDSFSLVKTGSQIVQIEIIQGNLIQAERAFSELKNAFKKYNQLPYYKEETRLEFLKSKHRLFEATQKIDKAYLALKEVSQLSDSINQAKASNSKERITTINELMLDQSKNGFKIEKAQKETIIRSQQLKLWVISITAISFVGFLTALYLRRKGRIIIAKNKQLIAEQNLKLTDLDNKQLQSEIESKKRDLSDFAINLSQNQEWAKVLADKLKQLKTTKGRERKMLLDDFEQDILGKIKFDHDTEDFYERLDKLSDSFYSVLHTNYPNLTKTEIRLCSLIRLKIDSYAIANLQNITISSLNTSRYRLRKKLNLSENDNLDEFIQFL
jgi:DNA-binding CsgD family transcriptional regulator